MLSLKNNNYDNTNLMCTSLMIVCLEGGGSYNARGACQINIMKSTSLSNILLLLIIKHIQLGLEYLCAFICVELVDFYVFCDIFSNIGIIIFSLKLSNSQTVKLSNSQTVAQQFHCGSCGHEVRLGFF